MASPAAVHLRSAPEARVARVHDRGGSGARRDAARDAWRTADAHLVTTLPAVVGDGDLDGVVLCCGKNGDDAPLVAELATLLQKSGKERPFLLHLSTVSSDFVDAATRVCAARGVAYANYPLTGGPLGAERGGGHPAGMLILAGGDRALYDRVEPTLLRLGRPRFLGERPAAGADTKLIGQHMVFCGCTGITAAAALHAQCFTGGVLGGPEQTEFFEFLNGGAGGTRQWEVALSKGIRDDTWGEGFLVRHAVVDAIYAAKLALDHGLSVLAVQPMVNIALAFSFLLEAYPEDELATHAMVRELLGGRARELDTFVARWSAPDPQVGLARCVESLPPDVAATVMLEVSDAALGG